MEENKLLNTLVKILLTLAAAAIVWVFFRYVFSWVLPFIIAFALARAIKRPTEYLSRRLRFPKSLAAGICTLLVLLIFFGLLSLAVSRGIFELSSLVQRLPELTEKLSGAIGSLRIRLESFTGSLPPEISNWLSSVTDSLFSGEGELGPIITQTLLSLLSSTASAMPQVLLFALTTSIATFFIAAQYDTVLEFLMAQLPARLHRSVLATKHEIKHSLWQWVKAQGILTLITFAELLLGLSFFRVDYALLTAAVIAIVDLLPVFGTGTVLIPWGVIMLLSGNMRLGTSLLILYAVITVVRNLVQPKLIGSSLGLSPLATLAALYVGFMAMGVAGMIIFPIVLIVLKKLNQTGVIHLWTET